ncbi:MAG: DUF1836 domain-containing protein [Oscillospiraceae bacterium]|nr:DUF1836 domain-containing protein [Oscillospiraceae bacterium]
MEDAARPALAAVCERLAGQRLPRWEELPDLELYMDQVLSLMDRYLGDCPGFDRKGLTASMVNNYVKLGVMPPPVKKKYSRAHLAHLIMICVLKASFPIDRVKRLLALLQQQRGEREGYDRFCDEYERALQDTAAANAADDGERVCRAALRAQAEQALALALCDAMFPEPEKKEKK